MPKKLGILTRIRYILLRWLFKDLVVEFDRVKARVIQVGDRTVILTGEWIVLAALTADPALAAGRMWFRSDLGKIRFSPDGTTVKTLYSVSG